MRPSAETPRLYLGVDLGGTKTGLSLWEESGAPGTLARGGEGPRPGPRLLGRARWGTPREGPDAAIERIVSEARRLLGTSAAGRLEAIGVSGGGPLDPERGTILSVPNLPGWKEVPLARLLAEALGAPVRIENDANACALAEWLYGAGKGARSLAFLTCSTGIGAGFVFDGRLYRGSRCLAGEVGHQVIIPDGLPCGCGGKGCLEAYASGAGIARRLEALRSRDSGLPRTAREVAERARSGDAFAREFLRETAEYLAMGLANLIFTVNPDRIVLGTIAVGAGEFLLAPLREALARRVWPSLLEGLEIRPALLGDSLGDHAALAVARDLWRYLAPSES
ncbi:MAG: ROK family protein [Planctomycetota bacterium]